MLSVATQDITGTMLSISKDKTSLVRFFPFPKGDRDRRRPQFTGVQTVKYSFLDPGGLNDNLLFLGYKMCCPLAEKTLIIHYQKIYIFNFFLAF